MKKKISSFWNFSSLSPLYSSPLFLFFLYFLSIKSNQERNLGSVQANGLETNFVKAHLAGSSHCLSKSLLTRPHVSLVLNWLRHWPLAELSIKAQAISTWSVSCHWFTSLARLSFKFRPGLKRARIKQRNSEGIFSTPSIFDLISIIYSS